ncbi:MAG TPA: glycosyltransferase family 9 protein [Puia sp.]|nr:glycosyltransferase family 9 protein [Puia sp.]
MQKFLVIQTAFIGDVVLATALIEKLHAFFPDAHIDFLVRKGNEALLAGHPWLNQVLVWDKKKGKLKNLWAMGGRIRREKYDKVINVQRFAATGLLTAFSGAKETIGFDKNPLSRWFSKNIPHIVGGQGKASLHEVERNQLLIRDFTDDVPAKPRLYPTVADEEKVRPYKVEKYITMSPASVWFTKQYPKEKWVEFLRVLPAEYTVYLLGGPPDKELCQQIVKEAGRGTDLSGLLSFLQSAALMKGAVMNYVNDSAPMHFASAVNAPVTAVYCSTIPGFGFGPLSDIKFVVEIKEPLDCRPCGLHGYKACPQGHFNCAYKIEEAQLLQTLINSRFNGH